MVQINLPEFYHYNLPQLLEFLTLQHEKEYNITLPKKTVTGINKTSRYFGNITTTVTLASNYTK